MAKAGVFGQADVERVEKLWAVVFESSNKVIHQHKKYGFDGFGNVPRPNVHDMLVTLKLLSAVIGVLLTAEEIEYEQSRQLLNAQAQITNMERLALALHAKNREDYDAAAEALEKQAPF